MRRAHWPLEPLAILSGAMFAVVDRQDESWTILRRAFDDVARELVYSESEANALYWAMFAVRIRAMDRALGLDA